MYHHQIQASFPVDATPYILPYTKIMSWYPMYYICIFVVKSFCYCNIVNSTSIAYLATSAGIECRAVLQYEFAIGRNDFRLELELITVLSE